MRVVYLAHPVAGAVRENLALAKRWQRVIEERFPDVAVSANWIIECEIWDDEKPEERSRAMRRNKAILERCDELWAVGGHVSRGMNEEIAHAFEHGIKVFELITYDAELVRMREVSL